ncbi:LOW QUALITY PROTEIN: uncharacterized protein LOC9324791 [Arabidopsis lyrata subsp. lyrata]|uniref:LOW QUALITY PROTEIN: uncharacterized protein LOC9324791 n=1 Tax=Arabidopsis lyrata subsp. lyrata TaxID=81972 RepID=UPI000A29D349|nr:LOW QUALITY PROTEIN: uncharacterized protein LOC9324791 [Arabidopsis lyrata subsp. lyrata]|eukprot:XP_020865841.1 LOW QUALITY PROTEIN: uncharacterized protein LOC9324791 [Arabidopsis lyrata subsp. lyrata]
MGASCSAPVSSTIKKNWRDHPPSSYSLKIHNFSQFENSTAFSDHKYQSRLFSSGGYNWRLIIYPKGNVKDNESGFISMYVELDSTSLTESTPTEVFAELRFFVYNKKKNPYFLSVKIKRFSALKMAWGLRKILPCDTFINRENGYIFEGGECEFGVDVIVSSPLTNWEILSFDEKLSYPKFSWSVENFSQLKEKEFYTSKRFSIGGREWFLELYPRGNARANGKYLSVYHNLADSETLKPDEKIFTQVHVRVLNPLGSNHLTAQMNCWHNHKESNFVWGWYHYHSLAEIRKTYLDKQDTLNIEAEFKVVSATKYSTIL